MKDFFAPLYELFKSLYGSDLADHLYGLNPNNSGNYDARSLYVMVGFICILSTAAFVVGYYLKVTSKYTRWFHWLGVLGVVWLINLFVGWWMPYKDFDSGNVAASVRDVIQPNHLWGFGFANSLLSIVFFVLFSIIMRRFSTNGSTTPFGTKFL